MGDKIKPWHRKEPKCQEKKVSPLRAGNGKRVVPLRISRQEQRAREEYQEFWADPCWQEPLTST